MIAQERHGRKPLEPQKPTPKTMWGQPPPAVQPSAARQWLATFGLRSLFRSSFRTAGVPPAVARASLGLRSGQAHPRIRTFHELSSLARLDSRGRLSLRCCC